MRVRDAVDGEDAIKERGEVYLPMLSGQKADGAAGKKDYENYKDRAMFYGAAERTSTGLAGIVLRKRPEVNWPVEDDVLLKSITHRGETLDELSRAVLLDQVSVGRIGCLVDGSQEENGRPFVTTYDAESILNWVEADIGGRMQPVIVHLLEHPEEDGKEEFEIVEGEQIRLLVLGFPVIATKANANGDEPPSAEEQFAAMGLNEEDLAKPFYFQQVWRKAKRDGKDEEVWMLDVQIIPRKKGGAVLREIPFVVLNACSVGFRPEKPPMLDFVNVNISHYRNSADLENGRHLTAIPTPVAAGFPKVAKLRIGGSIAWVAENPQATASYLEFTGAGLNHLAEGMRDKEKLMAVLGARLLEEQAPGVEAAETVKLRQGGERSVLSTVAATASEGLTLVLRHIHVWQTVALQTVQDAGLGDEVSIVFNQDFDAGRLSSLEITAMFAVMQGGGVSWQSFFEFMKQGEMIPEGRTAEEEMGLIAQGQPGAPIDEPAAEVFESGAGGNTQHRHPFNPRDPETATVEGHAHAISLENNGTITIMPWGTAETQHAHSVPAEARNALDVE